MAPAVCPQDEKAGAAELQALQGLGASSHHTHHVLSTPCAKSPFILLATCEVETTGYPSFSDQGAEAQSQGKLPVQVLRPPRPCWVCAPTPQAFSLTLLPLSVLSV